MDRPLHIVLYRHAIADLDRRMADSTLREALPEPEVHHLISQLPKDYGSLLER